MSDIRALKCNVSDLPQREPIPGIVAHRLAGENVMIQFLSVKKGTTAPQHRHENEQIMLLLEGRMQMVVGDADKGEATEIVMERGDVIHYPPNMPHGGEALDDCVILDIFSPPSETTGIDG